MAEEIVVHVPERELMLAPVMDLKTAKARLAEFQQFVKEYLVEGEDYGFIPGILKPTILKPGVDKLCELYGLSEEYEILSLYTKEDWAAVPPLIDYTIRCILSRGGIRREGLGSCNSYEGKYRWRDLKRKCPTCGQETVIKGKVEYGGGWVCWKKEGRSNGCGAKFSADAEAIVSQVVGRVENDDMATLKNTILKMAKKRAKADATLSATRSSGIFTQDMEDLQVQEEKADETATGAAQGTHTRRAGQVQVLISEAQRKEVFEVAEKFGWTKAFLTAWLKGTTGRGDSGYGFQSTGEILVEKFEEVKARLAQEGPAASSKQDGKDSRPPAPATPAVLTAPMLKVFWASVTNAGWTEAGAHVELERKYGLKSARAITRESLADVVAWFTKNPPTEARGEERFGLDDPEV